MKYVIEQIEAVSRYGPRPNTAIPLKRKRKDRRRRKMDRRSSVREGIVVSLFQGKERRKRWDRRQNN